MKYALLISPSHAWLRVPESDVRRSGVWERISTFSYVDASGNILLEEDVDAPTFVHAVESLKGGRAFIVEARIEDSERDNWIPFNPLA